MTGFGARIGSLRAQFLVIRALPILLGIGSASGTSVRESAGTTALPQVRAGLSGTYAGDDSHGGVESSCDTTGARIRRSEERSHPRAAGGDCASSPSAEVTTKKHQAMEPAVSRSNAEHERRLALVRAHVAACG